jgi:ABC-2 type transport system permease protein
MTATMEAAVAQARNGPAHTLAGTWSLLRFQLRRTRVYLIGWIAGLGGFSAVVAAAFPQLYTTPEERAEFAISVNTPAMRSMTGPERYFEFYADGPGAMYTHQMILWTAAVTAVMFILLVSRLTRAEWSHPD